ncbi:MAG: cytochrome b/b6 domain-containing protein, partial [Candidatus Heimdallarchaeota archaeon]|nr:cytochrome b/b6 domain-containing protein [Candidatus Heimdallarchaeota archaeon]MCK4877673.1 cytochrome b/b6 domain-containing protein [Candidatus Heimdallarchaeota archaeon]
MASFRVRIHRIVSWTLVVAFLTTIITGYAQTQNWFRDQYLLSKLHRIFEWIFLPLLIYHTVYVMFFVKIKLEKLVTKIKQRRGTTINSLRLVQKLSSWLILVFAVLIILSGLNGYVWFANTFGEIIPFTWHTTLDALLTISIFIHIAVGLKFFLMRRRVRKKIIDYTIVLVSVALIAGTIYLQIPSQGVLGPPPSPDEKTVTVNIAYEDYEFYTSEVETVRPDIFQPGYFSMFDVLVHLDEKNSINLEYHFDESMNTHVIDSLNGQTGWWYNAFYSGGWRETNAFRMDHYPWKNGTTLEIVSAT